MFHVRKKLLCNEVNLFIEEVSHILNSGLQDKVEFVCVVDWVHKVDTFIYFLSTVY